MTRAIVATVLLSFVLQGTVAVLAYLKFGSAVPSNILNVYASGYAPAAAARVAMALAVAFTYPLVHSTARYSLYSVICAAAAAGADVTVGADNNSNSNNSRNNKQQEQGQSRVARLRAWLGDGTGQPPLLLHVALTLLYVCVTFGVAVTIRDVGIVFSLLGSTAGVVTNYLVPALLVLQPQGPWRAQGRAHDVQAHPQQLCSCNSSSHSHNHSSESGMWGHDGAAETTPLLSVTGAWSASECESPCNCQHRPAPHASSVTSFSLAEERQVLGVHGVGTATVPSSTRRAFPCGVGSLGGHLGSFWRDVWRCPSFSQRLSLVTAFLVLVFSFPLIALGCATPFL